LAFWPSQYRLTFLCSGDPRRGKSEKAIDAVRRFLATTLADEIGMNSTCNAVATLVMTTKNRKDELCAALESAMAQSVPLEMVVIDDGSTDGTSELVRARFPAAKLFRSETSRGLIVQRNHGASLATTPFIFSIDDDAVFSTPNVVEQTLRDFDDSRIAAVAIPYIEPLKQNRLLQTAPSRLGIWITDSYVGTAHAVRRDPFLRVGGYREALVHQGEERDLCIRMLERGWFKRLGNSDPIIHYESPRRSFSRMDYYGRKNDILFAWHNVPWPWLPIHVIATTLNGVVAAFQARRFSSMFQGACMGYFDCIRRWSERSPVSRQTYALSRSLKKTGARRVDDTEPSKVENVLPSLACHETKETGV
jgi:glycosyltransferase involved in cell wall biosynthesis